LLGIPKNEALDLRHRNDRSLDHPVYKENKVVGSKL